MQREWINLLQKAEQERKYEYAELKHWTSDLGLEGVY